MQRITLLFMTAAMLGGGILAAVEGCSSNPTATPGGSSTSSSSSSGDNGTSGTVDTTSSSSSSSGTVFFDSGPTNVATPNPGQFSCGTVVCDAGGPNDNPNNPPVCCQRPASQTGTACVLSNNCDNLGPDASLQLDCDESADCPQSGNGQQQACCYVKDVQGFQGRNTTFSTQCGRVRDCVNFDQTTGDPIPMPILCKSSADCSDAGVDSGTAGVVAPCNQKTCDGFTVFVCGSPAGCQ